MPWVPLEVSANASDIVRAKKARFLVDESAGIGVAELLSHAGYNSLYVHQAGLTGHDDEDVIAFALKHDRVLLTHDAGFLNDRRFPPYRNPGVVVLPGGSGDDRGLRSALSSMLAFVGRFRDFFRQKKVLIAADETWTIIGRNHTTGAMQRNRFRFSANGPPLAWEDSSEQHLCKSN